MPDPTPLSVARERSFSLDGLRFLSDVAGRVKAADVGSDEYVLRKSDREIEFYRGLARRRPRHVLELGMFEGGSMVLWDRLFAPEILVGIDVRAKPVAPIERYRADRPHIRTYYGRGPDKPGTPMAVRESFPKGLDLVIDDSARRYDTTRQTFEALFPMLRQGGTYVVEGWAWAHKPGAQQEKHAAYKEPALTNLLFELTVLAATHRVIDSIHVEDGLFAVRKGPGNLPSGGIGAEIALRGRELSLI